MHTLLSQHQPERYIDVLKQMAEAHGHRLGASQKDKATGRWIKRCKHCGAKLRLDYKASQDAMIESTCSPQSRIIHMNVYEPAEQRGHWTEKRIFQRKVQRLKRKRR
jgi:hypothetical protein